MRKLSVDLVTLVVFFKMAEPLYLRFHVRQMVLKKVVSSAMLEVETEVRRA